MSVTFDNKEVTAEQRESFAISMDLLRQSELSALATDLATDIATDVIAEVQINATNLAINAATQATVNATLAASNAASSSAAVSAAALAASDAAAIAAANASNVAASALQQVTENIGEAELPHIPVNVVTFPAMTSIFLEWEEPNYIGHSHAEIWRAPTNSFSGAKLHALAPGTLYADAVGAKASYYYWVRFVNLRRQSGPFYATSIHGLTGENPGYLLEQLSNKITESQLYSTLNSRIDLIDGPSILNGSVAQRLSQESYARTQADLAEASARETIAARLNNIGGATIETAYGVQASLLAGVSAQYTLKIDNNGFLSGFGVSSEPVNGTPFSQFAFQADRFSIINPNSTPIGIVSINRSGSDPTAIAVVDTIVPHGKVTGDHVVVTGAVQYEYNGTKEITVVSPTAFTYPVQGNPSTPAVGTLKMGSASVPFIVDAGKVIIGTAFIKDASITSAKIQSVTADKIVAASLAAISANLGDISAGTFTLDANGYIRGGASSYSLGTGLWMGKHNGNYKWRVGIPGSSGAEWDGSSFKIYGPDGSVTLQSGTDIGTGSGTAAGIVGYLTVDSCTLAADHDGTVASFTATAGTFRVLDGLLDVTTGYGLVFSIVNAENCTGYIDPATGSYSVSAMSADTAQLTMRAVYDLVSVTKTMSLAKARSAVNYDIDVESTNGNIFRIGQSMTTMLIAHVYKNGVEITDTLSASAFRWRRVSAVDQPYPDDDATWNAAYATGYKQISVTTSSVAQRATFHCDITL
jgi:Domain of unknown function (DUF1983)